MSRPFAVLIFIFFCQGCTSKNHRSYEQTYEQEYDESPLKILDQIDLKNNRGNLNSIVSWNIQDLGKTKNSNELFKIAQIIKHFDLVMVQEVVGKDPKGAQAVSRMVDELNRMGFQWDYRVSDPTNSPSGNISERYAFIWKASKVSLLNRANLDLELKDVCDREPFLGKFLFKSKLDTINVVNFHSRPHDQGPEDEIFYFKDYQDRLGTENVVIGGDFNIDEDHIVWKAFYSRGYQNALSNTKTTLKNSCTNNNYLNHSIDNFYFAGAIRMVDSGTIDFVESCNNLKNARALSDHLPVYMIFD